MATALLVALCAGFYSCGGDNDETPLNNDDNSNISNENGNSVIVGTTAMVQLKKVGALSTLISISKCFISYGLYIIRNSKRCYTAI